MSWDVLVLNYGGRKPPEADDEPIDSLPLGPAVKVRQAITKHLPDVDWSDPAWGVFEAEEFSIEFSLGEADPVDAVMLHVRGGGEAIPTLLSFATPNGWSLFDCSTSEHLDPESPSSEGWEGFQDFRDRALGKQPSRKKPAKPKPKKAAARRATTPPKKAKVVPTKSTRKKTTPGKRAPRRKG